jgi:hypothetical protein
MQPPEGIEIAPLALNISLEKFTMPMLTLSAVGWLLAVMISGDCAWAAEQQKALQLMTNIQPRASLSLNRTQISFTSKADQRLISSQEGPVQITVKVRASASKSMTLNMRAETDLEGNNGYIPIKQVEWTTQGSKITRGSLSTSQDQMVAQWNTSGIHQTSLQFMLKNESKLPPGQHAAFVNFTLTSP